MVSQINGEKILVQIGDGASPEQFVHDCLINTKRGIEFSSSMTESINPSCDDPSAPAWVDREKDGLSATISGAGTVHTNSISTFATWHASSEPKNIRFNVDVPGSSGGGYWAGAFHLSEWGLTGNRKEKSTASVTLVSDGAVTWVDAA